MNRQSLVAKMLHLQVASALVCILLYFALLFATRAGLSYYNNHSDIQQRSIARQVERFQKYVTAQEISAKDTRAIDEWVGQQSFLLMNIYRGHRMLYSNFSFSFGDGPDEELDGLFERIYEDNVSGKLSDDRFAKMSRRYEDEQKEISEKIKALRAEMDKLSSKSVTADMFISTVRKYTRAKVLTPRMLNELIDHIEVHQAEKIDGIWEQHLVIHYNCVGAIFIPDVFPLPAPQVSVNTRKGVVVNYAPGQLAV